MTAPTVRIINADVREGLRQLADESVQCVVTSPPYWGLRAYEGEQETIWGGKTDHRHRWKVGERAPTKNATQGDTNSTGSHPSGHTVQQKKGKLEAGPGSPGSSCSCGAWRGSLGLEPTPEMFVEHMTEVFREVRRVLRTDGTCWLNMGDCYVSGGREPSSEGSKQTTNVGSLLGAKTPPSGLKLKDLVGMPWRLAFALQADGWWLRSDIIWSKPNPMPESISDRPTKAHEYIFLLTKAPHPTYWTHRALPGIRTQPRPDYRYTDRGLKVEHLEKPPEWNSKEKITCPDCKGGRRSDWFGDRECDTCKGKGKIKRWKRINLWRGHEYFYDAAAVREPSGPVRVGGKNNGLDKPKTPDPRKKQDALGKQTYTGFNDRWKDNPVQGRHLRDVWTIATQAYPEAHFATFPETLPERCIRAGTSERGCCPETGAPYQRKIEKTYAKEHRRAQGHQGDWRGGGGKAGKVGGMNDGTHPEGLIVKTVGWEPTCGAPWEREIGKIDRGRRGKVPDGWDAELGAHGTIHRKGRSKGEPGQILYEKTTTGWKPTCEHAAEPVPCVVLDPFAGSGTMGAVARRLGRSSILIEISEEYVKLIRKRTNASTVALDQFLS